LLTQPVPLRSMMLPLEYRGTNREPSQMPPLVALRHEQEFSCHWLYEILLAKIT